MGTSPSTCNEDMEDSDLDDSGIQSAEHLLEFCQKQLSTFPLPLVRNFISISSPDPSIELIRVLQWNILAQALGTTRDSFVKCPKEALEWKTRRWRILEELLTYLPDVICLQEVDHFKFLKQTLQSAGYSGVFFPKPDSPCCYIKGNNGPDGCALFINTAKFALNKVATKVLEANGAKTKQVAILVVLKRKDDDQDLCVVTTHLKAKISPSFVSLRLEESKDLIELCLPFYKQDMPIIICGDFNGVPTEPVYRYVTESFLELDSAYRYLSPEHEEPPYTTWKIREEGEIKHTIDYIFFTKSSLEPVQVLSIPKDEEIGPSRIPSLSYPSDHFSLVCDFSLKYKATSL